MIVTIGPGDSKPKQFIQKDLAREVGVSVGYICMCIKGSRQLNRRQALRLEKKFGIPIKFWPRLAA